MTSRRQFFPACVSWTWLVLLYGCELPAAWTPSKDQDAKAPVQHASVAPTPTRTPCGEGDASCNVPIGLYSIGYTFVSGTCRDESSETGVRFSENSEDLKDFPCDDHEVSMTPDNALYIDRECRMLDPESGLLLRRTRARATIRGPNANGEISGQLDLTVLQGPGAPCTAQYLLLGTRE